MLFANPSFSIDQDIKDIIDTIDAAKKGCFQINQDFDIETFLPIIRSIRASYPDFWIGINFLAVNGLNAFPILASLENEGCRIDSYWGDDARIDEREPHQAEAAAIAKTRKECGWHGLYFGGTAFKKQRPVNPKDYAVSAMLAADYMDVVTTSGIATGNAAEISKIATFRSALPDAPIALASGITPDNAIDYKMVDCFMVATGINIDNDVLQTGLEFNQTLRKERAKKIALSLLRSGIKDALEKAQTISGGHMLTRTHFAQMLINEGYCKDMKTVFRRYLTGRKPGGVRVEWKDLDEVIHWIHAAGGKALIAHPFRYRMTHTTIKKMLKKNRTTGNH